MMREYGGNRPLVRKLILRRRYKTAEALKSAFVTRNISGKWIIVKSGKWYRAVDAKDCYCTDGTICGFFTVPLMGENK